jgi:hypothetical protein
MHITRRILPGAPRFAAGLLALLLAAAAQGSESWHASPGAGWLLLPGSTPLRDGPAATLRLGYDFDAPVSLELGGLAASLASRLPGGGRHDLYGAWADAILHFARWERFDPFVSAGVGALGSDARALPGDRRAACTPRLGAGAMYTLTEHWSVRAGVTVLTTQPNHRESCCALVEAGLFYYFGDTTPARPGTAD